MIMKLMVLADPHQSDDKWELLVKDILEKRPDIIAVAGDLLPKSNGILGQLSFAKVLRKYAQIIKDAGSELVLILGNDDNRLFITEMEKGDREGLWHYVADRVKEVKGYDFCGCPWIRDYPFGYKYWVAAESPEDVFINSFQIGPPVVISENNKLETIYDFKEYLVNKPSITESLEKMADQVKDMSKSIWLIHCPPVNLGLDLCGSGDYVGSPAIYKFLSERQPLLSVHGHIHEAPDVNGQIWAGKIGKTLCIQAGQLDGDVHYVMFNLTDGAIKNLNHSGYGKQNDFR